MNKKPLGEILVEMEIINEDQLQQALTYQKENQCRFGKALFQLGFATKADIFKALVAQYGYPYIELAGLEVGEDVIDKVPGEIARGHRLVPVEYHDDIIRIAMSPPFELEKINALEQQLGLRIEFALTTQDQIQQALEQYYPSVESA